MSRDLISFICKCDAATGFKKAGDTCVSDLQIKPIEDLYPLVMAKVVKYYNGKGVEVSQILDSSLMNYFYYRVIHIFISNNSILVSF